MSRLLTITLLGVTVAAADTRLALAFISIGAVWLPPGFSSMTTRIARTAITSLLVAQGNYFISPLINEALTSYPCIRSRAIIVISAYDQTFAI